MSELISVIMPAHNAARFLRAAIASVLKQTHTNFELVLIDDGSIDETAKIASNMAGEDGRVRLMRIAKSGVSAARNFGISRARGRLIATIDADDLWHPNKLEWQLAALKSAGTKTGVVYCWSVGINEDDKVILPAWNKSAATGFVLHDLIVSGILGNGSTPLMRLDAVLAAGGYDETLSLCEDWKFYTALAGLSEFTVVPAFLTGYRLRDDSASVNVQKMEEAIAGVTEWIMQRWPEVPSDLLQDRRHVVKAYLAALAVRTREFSGAVRYLGEALIARPSRIVDASYVRLFFFLMAHALGLRVYRWDFWRTPDFSEFCKSQQLCFGRLIKQRTPG